MRIARRDLRSSPYRAIAAVLAIGAGTGAVTATRGLGAEMYTKLQGDAREWIAADLYAAMPQPPSPEELELLAPLHQSGVERTVVSEFYSMVASQESPDASLAFLKVVDPAFYPFYGTVGLHPPQPLREALHGDSVAVSQDLLDKLKLRIGGTLRISKADFRVAAVIVAEPDWSAGVSTVLPRVLLSPEAVDRAGANLQGSVTRKVLFRLGRADLAASRSVVERAFPFAAVIDYRDPDPIAAAAFEQAIVFLSVAAWIALAFGSLAMAVIMNLHVQVRLNSVATMKALGGRCNQIVAIYAFQALGLAIFGGVLGSVLAYPLETAFASLVDYFFPIGLTAHWRWTLTAQALVVGSLASLPSVVGPILRLRDVSPLGMLRRHMSVSWTPPRRATLLLQFLPLYVRLALCNIFRRGTHATTIVFALSGGVAMLCAIYFCKQQITDSVVQSIPAPGSSVYVISAGRTQLEEATQWLTQQTGIPNTVRAFPLVWLQLIRINGSVPAGVMPQRWLASCSESVPSGQILLSRKHSEYVKAGDSLEFASQGLTLSGEVVVGSADFLGAVVSVLTFSCSSLSELNVFYHAAIRLPPSREVEIRRALADRYPALPTLSGSEVGGLVGKIAGRAITMVQILCWTVLTIGAVLQMMLVASTRALRREEIALTKALGAGRQLLARMWFIEFGMIGLMAGVAGTALGAAIASLLLTTFLHRTTLAFDVGTITVAVCLTTILTGVAGCLANARLLRIMPIEILREL
ncbi:MAG: FtsX-like permease family protein [Acidobacteriota bacterium]